MLKVKFELRLYVSENEYNQLKMRVSVDSNKIIGVRWEPFGLTFNDINDNNILKIIGQGGHWELDK